MKKLPIFAISISGSFILLIGSFLFSYHANTEIQEIDKKVDSIDTALKYKDKLYEIHLDDTSSSFNDTVYAFISRTQDLINTTQDLTNTIHDFVVVTNKIISRSVSVKQLMPPSRSSIIIGTQEWMTKNLDVNSFSDGTQILEAKTKEEWVKAAKAKKPAWCFFANDSANGKFFGKLYNWFAVIDKRGLAPKGWHLPNIDEWYKLSDYLGAEASNSMKSMYGWANDVNGNNGNGDNKSGFYGFPAGIRNCFGDFSERGCYVYFWSISEGSNENAYFRSLNFDETSLTGGYCPKGDGFSCRCIKNN